MIPLASEPHLPLSADGSSPLPLDQQRLCAAVLAVQAIVKEETWQAF